MSITLRLAVRDWDYLTPLALGDVRSSRINVILDRVGTLVSHPALMKLMTRLKCPLAVMRQCALRAMTASSAFRTSLCEASAIGVSSPVATATFVISRICRVKIGVTGWRDSGNIWTRAALRLEGVGVDDARWYAGRLTGAHPITDRLDGFGRPGHIEAMPGEKPMMEMLRDGFLDAVFTPFMPDGFFGKEPGFRQLLDDFRGAERTYFDQVGYVPACI